MSGQDTQQSVSQVIRQLAGTYEDDIVSWRRHFHQYPELSRNETQTSAYIRNLLGEWGVEHRLVEGAYPDATGNDQLQYAGTGIIATIHGEAEGAYEADGAPMRRIALRADMDALPIVEQTGLEFSSRNEGVMHACGHDCHMAMMLGAVRILQQLRSRLRGEVRVIFQPDEEVARGAREMIAAGAVDGVDAIYGAHIWSEVDAGTFSCEQGPRMAFTDWFRIDVEGRSAHGSMPHKGVDAIVVAAEIVSSLQMIASRLTSPFDPVIVTVGEIHGGTARNIVAGSAFLTGTLRTCRPDVRESVIAHMERIAAEVARAFGATVSLSLEAGNPAVVNDPSCAEAARKAVVEVLGPQAVSSYEGTLAGEDFAEYLQRVPGVFVFVGTRNSAIGAIHPQHSSHYTVDETVLAKGAAVAAQWACDMLA